MTKPEESLEGFAVCFCPQFAGDPPTLHQPGEEGCAYDDQGNVRPDLLGQTEVGDADPGLDGHDESRLCGAKTQTGPNSWNEVSCVRFPHPAEWIHISVADDEVDYVWRDLTPAELEHLVLTDEGVLCKFCGWSWTTRQDHDSGCRLAPKEEQESEVIDGHQDEGRSDSSM